MSRRCPRLVRGAVREGLGNPVPVVSVPAASVSDPVLGGRVARDGVVTGAAGGVAGAPGAATSVPPFSRCSLRTPATATRS